MGANLCRFGLVVFFPTMMAVAGQPPATDYTEFSRLVHKILTERMPKEFEDRSGWGATIPIPDKLRLPGITRVRVQVGNHEEYPQGNWKRYRIWMDDPAKDVKIRVLEFKANDSKTSRLVLEADAAVHTELFMQQWLKGIPLLDGNASADAVAHIKITCDIQTTLVTAFPPKFTVAPKIAELSTELQQFNLKKASAIVEVEGKSARALGNELKDGLQLLLKLREPQIKENANEAIAKALQEGQGTISAATLIEALSQKK